MERLFSTNDSWNGLILRVGLGIVMFSQGAQNLMGWFGGQGFDQTMLVLTTQLQIPRLIAVLIILTQFFGGIGLIVGAYVRVAAFGIVCLMLSAIVTYAWNNGFFVNWADKQPSQGCEFHLLAITISVAIMIWGAGKWSIDRAMESPRSRIDRQRAAEEELTVQPPSHL